MTDFTPFLACLSACPGPTPLRQLTGLIPAMLAITGRVTMKGLSRWALTGASYRTIQRFFHTVVAWKQIHWLFIRHDLLDPDDVYLVAGDEVVISKASSRRGWGEITAAFALSRCGWGEIAAAFASSRCEWAEIIADLEPSRRRGAVQWEDCEVRASEQIAVS